LATLKLIFEMYFYYALKEINIITKTTIMKKTLFIFCLLLASSGIWAQATTEDLNNPTPSTDIVLNFERSDCEQSENSIHKISLAPNITINDTLNVCENKWTTFYINGGNLKNIIKITWEVTGGEVKKNGDIVASIFWGEIGIASVKVKIVLDNLTAFENTIQLRKNSKEGDVVLFPNSIKFDYDTAGNQKKRSMIYLARVSNPNTDDNSKETPKYVETGDYEDVLYYPNPVKQELNVKWVEKAEQDMQRMELYDLNGRLMHSFPNQSAVDTAVINFDNYPSGIYSLVLVYAGGGNKTLKIVKQ
jgi:Secretion system C-terminal sorting domain